MKPLYVTATKPSDIHRAYLGGLSFLVHNLLPEKDEVQVVLDHEEPSHVVRGYHEPFLHDGEKEIRRLSGGGSYYHLQTEPENDDWDVPTRCLNIVKAVEDSTEISRYRHKFGDRLTDLVLEHTAGLTDDDLAYSFDDDLDIYVASTDEQIVSASIRHYQFSHEFQKETGKHGGLIYRACVQTLPSFDQSVEDSAWLLRRDGISPERYRSAVRPVRTSFANPEQEPETDIDDLIGDAHTIDNLAGELTTNTNPGDHYPYFLRDSPVKKVSGRKDPYACILSRPASPTSGSYLAPYPYKEPSWYPTNGTNLNP